MLISSRVTFIVPTETSLYKSVIMRVLQGIETFCATCRDYLANDNSQACFLFDKQLQEVLLNTNKEERKQHIREFLIMVNALLNDGGGVIYVHTQPRLLGFWDEQVGVGTTGETR